jgi:hypothetical protein
MNRKIQSVQPEFMAVCYTKDSDSSSNRFKHTFHHLLIGSISINWPKPEHQWLSEPAVKKREIYHK